MLGLVNQPAQNIGGNVGEGNNQQQPSQQPPVVQSLPRNVIKKEPSTMKTGYIQQKSQIFSFQTDLAKKSEKSVLQGHRSQPGTKEYLKVCKNIYFRNFYSIDRH